jgi:hypothetical protein
MVSPSIPGDELSGGWRMIQCSEKVDAAWRALIAPRPALAVGAIFLLSAFSVAAQFEVNRCLPPEAPIVTLPETAAEFDAYFVAISDYIACLDDERARALAEAHMATDAYSTVLNATPTRKDRP